MFFPSQKYNFRADRRIIVNNLTMQVLKILEKSKGDYISGQKISNTLDVSRTTIWKHIQKLKDKGFEIESVSNRGYSLKTEPDKIMPETIFLGLETEKLPTDVYYYECIGSTNKKAKEVANEGDCSDGTMIIADEQKKGSGRRGRNWYSPPGTGLWFSLLLKPDFTPEKAPFLTITASLAVHQALTEMGFSPRLKWPNDVLINNKKICGILSELSAELGYIKYAVVGIGINVNQQQFPEEISEIATSLYQVKERKVNRKELLQNILKFFEQYYKLLTADKEDVLLNQWRDKLAIVGKCIEISSNGKIYTGEVIDLSDKGELILKTQSGEIKSFWAGDTSLIR
mgnify:CR=1 FL=1